MEAIHAAIHDSGAFTLENVARSVTTAAAQAYANRMWAGQSISLSRHERLGRIKAALEAQGMSMEGVTL